jgi:2-haloacid dehalogenase
VARLAGGTGLNGTAGAIRALSRGQAIETEKDDADRGSLPRQCERSPPSAAALRGGRETPSVTGPHKPEVLVFDVNETLLDIDTLMPLFERLFGDGMVMREWFAQLVLYSEAMALSGRYTPFGTIGAGVLRMLGEIRGVPVGDGDVAELRARTLAMPAHADVMPALERLKNAGFRLVTLTNSAPDPEASPLQRSGIAGLTERQFSVDAVRRFKPHPDCYRQVAEALDLPATAFCMVAAHVWDTAGAQSLGWSGALVARPGNAVPSVPNLPEPTLVAPDLGSLADAVIGHWR